MALKTMTFVLSLSFRHCPRLFQGQLELDVRTSLTTTSHCSLCAPWSSSQKGSTDQSACSAHGASIYCLSQAQLASEHRPCISQQVNKQTFALAGNRLLFNKELLKSCLSLQGESALRYNRTACLCVYHTEPNTNQHKLEGSCFILTSSIDIFLTGVPDPSVEIPEKEAVISSLPAVMNHILVCLICSLIPAVVEAVCLLLFPTARLGDPLCALTPVGRDKSCCREEESHQIQTHC